MKAETDLILQCNRNSFIEQVMYTRENLDTTALLHQPLLFCLAPESLDRGKQFLEDIRWTGKAENFELEILLEDKKHLFSFSGVLLRDHIIIVAQHAEPVVQAEPPVAEMVKAEVESSISGAVELPEPETQAEVTVWDLLEEMSRLNNELINTKRELIQKNMELERLQLELKKR